MPLNENIRNARKKKGLKQVELADMAGISVNSVRLYESGKIEPQVSTLARIADVLGVSVGELLADNWGSGPDTPQLSNEVDETAAPPFLQSRNSAMVLESQLRTFFILICSVIWNKKSNNGALFASIL